MPSPAGLPPTISRIVLTGFMGAGKSTVGAHLAARLGWRFLDSDQLIEFHAGRTIGEIFADQGEEAFRKLEAATIREAASGNRLVLALGGGAIENPGTRELLSSLPGTFVVFLDAPLETLVARCTQHSGGPVRPVLADRARLESRWRARLPWYREAHLTIATGQIPPETVAGAILTGIQAACAGAPA